MTMIKREREIDPSPPSIQIKPRDDFPRRLRTYVSLLLPYPLGSLFGSISGPSPLFFPGGRFVVNRSNRLKTLAPVTRYANIFTAPLHLTAEINDSREREREGGGGIVDEDRDVFSAAEKFRHGSRSKGWLNLRFFLVDSFSFPFPLPLFPLPWDRQIRRIRFEKGVQWERRRRSSLIEINSESIKSTFKFSLE